jgi:hypothetical protein
MNKETLSCGDRVKFAEEVKPYMVQAANEAFAVLTKPFNLKKTVLYTVIDWKRGVRGTENLVFGMGAETREQCEEMLERLTQGETEVSYRNYIPIRIERVWKRQEGR